MVYWGWDLLEDYGYKYVSRKIGAKSGFTGKLCYCEASVGPNKASIYLKESKWARNLKDANGAGYDLNHVEV